MEDPSLANGIADIHTADMPKPMAQVLSVTPASGGEKVVNLVAVLNVLNPNSIRIPVQDITYHLESTSSVDLAHGIIPSPGSLTPRGNVQLSVPLSIHYSALSGLVTEKTPEMSIPYNLKMRLNFNVPPKGRFAVPCKYSSTVDVPTPPDLFSNDTAATAETVERGAPATTIVEPSGTGWMKKMLGPCCGVSQPNAAA